MSKTIRIEYFGIEGEGPTVKEAKGSRNGSPSPLRSINPGTAIAPIPCWH
jgi:hypothetical protein